MRSRERVPPCGRRVHGRLLWTGILVLVVAACASSRTARDPFDDDPFLAELAADDPFFSGTSPDGFGDAFDDPFFREGMAAGDSLDEFLREPAPSVGWLSDDSPRELEGGDPFGRPGDEFANLFGDEDGDEDEDEDDDHAAADPNAADERPFAQQAQEAALATMSVLVGAGMAALPYLLAAF